MRNVTPVSLVCGVSFTLFVFCWVFFFQADMLAVAQHGLSGGLTHYDRTVGAVIITAVLGVLAFLVQTFVRVPMRFHALAYLPSMLLLAFVSSASHPFRWGAWPWAAPLVLALWVAALVAERKLLLPERPPLQFFSPQLWGNLLLLAAMMGCVAAVSDTHAVRHFRAHAEVALGRGDPAEALRAGHRSWETDESLTMLRILALSERGELAQRLFTYPVAGTSADMLPLAGSKSRLLLMPDTLLWDHLGLRPDSLLDHGRQRLTTRQYLDSLAARPDTLPQAWRDYRLMGLLIDRQIDSFALCLPRHYVLEPDSLPRHYREALVLCQQTVTPQLDYTDSLMLMAWQLMHADDSLYHTRQEWLLRNEGDFGHTYWHYFYRQAGSLE